MPDTITPELAEKYTRQTIAINRIVWPLFLALSSYGLWADVRRWQHSAGNSYALAFALHAIVCALWVAFFLVVMVSEKIFSRSYRPPYDPHKYDLFAPFTTQKALIQLLYYVSYWTTFQAFLHGGELHRNSASFIQSETLFAMAGTLTLDILVARRILRKHKQAHNG